MTGSGEAARVTGADPRILVLIVDAGGSAPPAVLAGAGVRRVVEIVGRTAAPAAAARLAAHARPGLVVVDLDACPAAEAAIAAVAAAVPQIPLLALAAAPDHETVLAAVRAGASSLVRSTETEGLAAAVIRTARGEAVFSPGLADVVLAEFGRPADPQLAARQLTEREADVLRLVVEGLTARQIGTRLGLSPRTVENHLQHVLRKLRLHSRAALVRYAIESGLA